MISICYGVDTVPSPDTHYILGVSLSPFAIYIVASPQNKYLNIRQKWVAKHRNGSQIFPLICLNITFYIMRQKICNKKRGRGSRGDFFWGFVISVLFFGVSVNFEGKKSAVFDALSTARHPCGTVATKTSCPPHIRPLNCFWKRMFICEYDNTSVINGSDTVVLRMGSGTCPMRRTHVRRKFFLHKENVNDFISYWTGNEWQIVTFLDPVTLVLVPNSLAGCHNFWHENVKIGTWLRPRRVDASVIVFGHDFFDLRIGLDF